MNIPVDLANFDLTSFVLGAATGGVGIGGLALIRFRKSQSQMGSGNNQVDQSGIKANGNIVGRDNSEK